MKYFLTFIISLITLTSAFSQAPAVINYQGAARDQFGQPLANTSIGIRFELIQGNTATNVFTESQTVITNSLGLFTTQIGKQSPNGLNAINFNAGTLLLKIGMDVNGGTSYVNLGTQTLTSVPFALYASDIPTTYSNNVLTIGKSTFTLSGNGSVYTAGNGISVLSNTIINTAPDQTVSLTPGNSNVAVSGTYPNFTIATSPQLSLLAPGTLSISNGNSVNINPALTFTNGLLTVGSTGNSVQIGSSGTTSLQGGGAANVQTLSANAYSISVPATSLTNGQNVAVSGTFPSYTISATPSLAITGNTLSISGANSITLPATSAQSLSLLGPNSLSITGANSVAIVPTLSLTGTILSVAAAANSVALPTPVITGLGAASVSSLAPNNFSINVPQPSLSIASGSISISGGNSVALPAQVAQSLTLLAPNTVSISGGNTISIPAGSLIGTGMASVTPFAFNSFLINVPPSSLSISNGSIGITGGNTVALPAQVAQSLTLLPPNTVSITGGNTISIPAGSLIGTGIASVTPFGFNSFSVNVPQTNVNPGTNVQVNGSFPNYTIAATPQLSINSNSVSISGGNTIVLPAQVNQSLSVSGNTLSITNGTSVVLAPTLSNTNNILTVGPASNSITLATPTIVGTGALNASNPSVNVYSLNVPLTQLSQGSNVQISGIYPSFTIASTPSLAINANTITISNGNSIAIPSVALTAAGMATLVNNASSYTVGVPVWTYTSNTGVIASGTNTLDITPALSLNAGTLTVGRSTNSVVIPGLLTGGSPNYLSKWNSATTLAGTSLLFDDGTNVGVGTISPTQRLDIAGNLRMSGALMPAGSAGSAGQLLQSAGAGLPPNWVTSGLLAGGTLNYLPKWNSVTGLSSTSQLFDDGTNVGIGTTSPASKLHISSTSFNLLSLTTTGANNNVNIDAYPTGSGNLQITAGNAATNGLAIVTNGASRMVVNGSGNVGIGTTSPLWTLDVVGQTQFQSSLISTGYETEIINNTSSATSSGGLQVTNTGLRSIGNNAASIENLVTKNGGSNSIKTGLEIISTGGWGTGGFGGHYNRGLFVNVSGGADGNYSAILMGGNVGIGNLTPNAALQFTNTITSRKIVLYETANNDHQFYGFGVNSGGLRYQTDATASDHVFYAGLSATGSSELMRIKGNGDVGIGVTAPLHKVHINDFGASGTALQAENLFTGTFNGYGVVGRANNAPGYGYGGAFDGGFMGLYGLGGGGSYTGSVYGVYGQASGSGGARYGVFGNGSTGTPNYAVYASGAMAYTGILSNLSDRRFKKDIQNLDHALDRLLLLEPKTYNMRTTEYAHMNLSDKKQFGLISQEVELVFPELIEENIHPAPIDPETKKPVGEDTKYKGLNYMGLTPIMIQAIKEQQDMILELKKQVEAQQKIIEELQKK